MKKRVLLYFATAVLIAMPQQMMADDIAINETNFPDEIFRNWVLAQDFGQDGVLTKAEIATVIKIDVNSQNISDLKGIEYFTALELLYCNGNQLTSLDMSQNTALTRLDCYYNMLTSLDVSKNTALTTLNCYYNQLISLDVSNNNLLRVFRCFNNRLTSLGVSKNTALTSLWCYQNQLTTLDVSNNKALTSLQCGQNQLTALDVSKNTALTDLSCSSNLLTSLDVSQNTALSILFCNHNQLTSLNLSKNIALTHLNCYYNQLTALDVSKNTALFELWCWNNQLTSLDVSQNTTLATLYCYSNQLTSLDVSKNTALEVLSCENNQLTSLDVSQNTALTELYCDLNQLTSLNVSQNTALTRLSCGYNQLASLDVSKNTTLTVLSCGYNQLTSLDVSKNTTLSVLSCEGNIIKGDAMDALIEGLSENGGEFFAICPDDSNEKNVVTKAQVAAAQAKGWTTYFYSYYTGNYGWYEGSEPEVVEIQPVDQGETIDIGTEIDANTNLDGNVVGDVFYSISSGDGSYAPEEGCIVVTKPTDDSAIDGKDIFGEDFKAGYTGIVFKVNEGKGSIKVEAQTQGNMVLKVKIGDNAPVEMELEGKLKVKFPYSVSEETLVYIYGGTSAAGAKGIRKAAGEDALKIYGIEVTSETDGIKDIKNERLKMKDSPVYNLNGQRVISSPSGRPGGVPTKGVYIINGKKMVVK